MLTFYEKISAKVPKNSGTAKKMYYLLCPFAFFCYFCNVINKKNNGKMKKNLLLTTALAALTACGGSGSGTTASEADSLGLSADSISEEVVEARCVGGFVGTGTSMNVIELVSPEATDTLWVEMDDETIREATLEVGREIVAVVVDQPDGTLRAMLTMDADENEDAEATAE